MKEANGDGEILIKKNVKLLHTYLLYTGSCFWASTILLGSETRQGEGATAAISASSLQGCADPALTPDWSF